MKPRIIIVAVLLVAATVTLVVLSRRGGNVALVGAGTVEATDAALGFQVPGRVAQVAPREGERVRAGDTLALLDRAELLARHRQAAASLAASRAVLLELERGSRTEELAQVRAADSAALVRLADAQRDFDRTQRLFQGGALPQEAYDKARTLLDLARSTRAQAAEQRQLVERGPREERVAAQRAAVEAAQAAVAQADAALANAVIVAPFDGVVTVRNREPGETVGAGAPVLTLVNMADRWVRIYIAEDRIGQVSLGDRADITTDSHAGRRYGGTVSFIASEAEFTPRNVQTTAERVKLVFAVKVRVDADSTLDLKPGMPADVTLARGAASRPAAP
jgi:HlyD family secretion protein